MGRPRSGLINAERLKCKYRYKQAIKAAMQDNDAILQKKHFSVRFGSWGGIFHILTRLSLSSKYTVETNRETDGQTERLADTTDCITFPANAVGKYKHGI